MTRGMSSSGRRLMVTTHHMVDRLYDCDMATSQAGSKLNQSVQTAITLLRATAASSEGASVSALARAAGLPRATALRLIQTMEREGFLVRGSDADRVRLGPELVRLARGVDTAGLLQEVARRPLRGAGGGPGG